jgi:hypothetical protein
MNASVITALAALAGAAIGGLTSVLASWLTQRMQVRAQWLAQDILLRQELYKEFIEEASKCYIDALQHDNADIPALVGTYANMGRMRVVPRQRSSKAPNKSDERLSVHIWSRTRPSSSSERWQIAGRSTFFAISVKPAAQNSSRFALDNSETKGVWLTPIEIKAWRQPVLNLLRMSGHL